MSDQPVIPPEVPLCAGTFFECLHKPWHAVTLREMFTSALKVHYMDPIHHREAVGGDYLDCVVYDEHEQVERSKRITVAPMHTFDENHAVPGVYVGTSPQMANSKQVLDNYGHDSPSSAAQQYTMRASCPILFKHIHRSADVALLMATSTSVFLSALRVHLKGHPDFLQFDPMAHTDASLLKSGPEKHYGVDLAWNLSFNYRVQISLESHRLKKFGLMISDFN